MLTAVVLEFTRPMYSSITLGGSPCAWIRAGLLSFIAMTCPRGRSPGGLGIGWVKIGLRAFGGQPFRFPPCNPGIGFKYRCRCRRRHCMDRTTATPDFMALVGVYHATS
jgi:hypothetical protein